MIDARGKRKLVFRGRVFYWYIKKDETGYPYIFVFSEDKRLRITEPLIDSEDICGPRAAIVLLQAHFKT